MNRLGQHHVAVAEAVGAEAGKQIDHRRFAGLQPAGIGQASVRRSQPNLSGSSRFVKGEVVVVEIDGIVERLHGLVVRRIVEGKIEHAFLPFERDINAHQAVRIVFRSDQVVVGIDLINNIVVGEERSGGKQIFGRIEEGVAQATEKIALVARAQHGEHQISLRLPAPRAEGLAQVFLGAANAHIAGGIEQPEQAQSGVDQEPIGFHARALEFSLQEVVRKPDGKREIVAESANAVAHGQRQDEAIDLAGGRDNANHEQMIHHGD
ncbi:MAG: hypothetical protein BWZ10_01984 [candidate division BRC1 bacterium ADurb.BinA364]|nr:MAG: hypothetical protein BWZ10_01984 [candidate division BRC1 bacterium ADurb.BinA364]